MPNMSTHVLSTSRKHIWSGDSGKALGNVAGVQCWRPPVSDRSFSPTLLGPVLMWSQQNYLRLLKTVTYFESFQVWCPCNPPETKNKYTKINEWNNFIDLSLYFRYDILANGGGAVTVTFSRNSFVDTSVTVFLPWNNYVIAPTTVMRTQSEPNEPSEVHGTCDTSRLPPPASSLLVSSVRAFTSTTCSDRGAVIPEIQVCFCVFMALVSCDYFIFHIALYHVTSQAMHASVFKITLILLIVE